MRRLACTESLRALPGGGEGGRSPTPCRAVPRGGLPIPGSVWSGAKPSAYSKGGAGRGEGFFSWFLNESMGGSRILQRLHAHLTLLKAPEAPQGAGTSQLRIAAHGQGETFPQGHLLVELPARCAIAHLTMHAKPHPCPLCTMPALENLSSCLLMPHPASCLPPS